MSNRNRGVALLIALFMVSFLLIMVTANANAISSLKREIKLVERKQNARWAQTNRVAQTSTPRP